MLSFLHKQSERFVYLWLLLSLAVGYVVAKILISIAPLLRSRKPSKDFLFFPYAHKDNTGTTSRFQEYFPLLDDDGFTYDVHYPSTKQEYDDLYHKPHPSRVKEYWYYHYIFWKRLKLITTASRYKAVFFQRALFPEYPDQRRAILEQLLRAYSNNITVDYFDSDFARNEIFYRNVVRYCDKVTVVNQFLFDHYIQIHPRVFINNLSIDTSRYKTKSDFTIHLPKESFGQPVRFFWTGLIENAEMNLPLVMPLLEELHATRPLTLVMICNSRRGFDQSFIEYHTWNLNTFYDLLTGCDIALYPVMTDDVYSRGKTAYKALEYAASGVPMVASPQGLSPHFKHGEDVLIANNAGEWKQHIATLLNDEPLREQLAASARQKVTTHHDVRATYRNLISILQA